MDVDDPKDVLQRVKYEVIDDVLHRRTILGEHEDGVGISRVYVPANLRVAILRNSHDSVWGGHRNAVATFKERHFRCNIRWTLGMVNPRS